MLLRGPQSAGELKTRSERYSTSQGSGFASLDDIEAALATLADGRDPFIINIGRGSGQSQDRWAHLLGDGEPDDGHSGSVPALAQSDGPSLAQRVADLEDRLARLEVALGVADEVTEQPNNEQEEPEPSHSAGSDDAGGLSDAWRP